MSADPISTSHIHLNGAILPIEKAQISVLDRGFLFGDGVYELVRVFSGVPLAMDQHVQRLEKSLHATGITGFEAAGYHAIVEELLQVNHLEDACIYLQVTRGQGPLREHLPEPSVAPTVFAMAAPSPGVASLDAPHTTKAILHPDERWVRCEIKAITLLPNVLAMISANEHDATEAILHREGLITEGTSSNVLVVIDGCLCTPPITPTHSILHGTMRTLALKAAAEEGIQSEERPITLNELPSASEMALTSSRRLLHRLTHLDGAPIGTDDGASSVIDRVFTRMRAMIISAIEDRDRAIQMAP